MTDHCDRAVNQLTREPVPQFAAGQWGCDLCREMNRAAERHDAPGVWDAEFEDGDDVIFFASSKEIEDGTGDPYVITRGVLHRRHHGEFRQFSLGDGDLGFWNVLVTATVRQTGYDYGALKQKLHPDWDYEPDYDGEAFTFRNVEIVESAGPEVGTEPPGPTTAGDDEFATPLRLNPGWSEGRQRMVYEHIQEHS